MAVAQVSDQDFARLIESLGNQGTADHLGIKVRSVYERKKRLEETGWPKMQTPLGPGAKPRFRINHPGKLDLKVWDGVVIIASDCHFWPGVVSTAHRALLKFCKQLKPAAVIMNGDVLDGATISRHPPIGWTHLPTLAQEIECVQDRLGEITKAAGSAERYWTMGNHCARFESMLAKAVPEVRGVKGMELHAFFPDYQPCWMVVINEEVVVKHRFRNGIHATHNNTMWAGKTIVTGHLHSLKVTPLSDYDGTRWGVDCGTTAIPYTDPFIYNELNPVNWRSGFAILTFHQGELAWPELVAVRDEAEGIVDFRGKFVKV